MKIILGSTSVHKLRALKKACEKISLDASVSGIKTSSGQNEQPVGFEETFNGALTRAKTVRAEDPTAVAIGIESGIFRFNGTTLDIAAVVILTSDGRQILVTSNGFEFPENNVNTAEERGFKSVTVGKVIAEDFASDPTDPHSTLSKGKVTREATLIETLVIGLVQI